MTLRVSSDHVMLVEQTMLVKNFREVVVASSAKEGDLRICWWRSDYQ